MPATWNQIASDQDYIGLPEPEKVKVQRDFFSSQIARDPDFQALPPVEKQTVVRDFFSTAQAVQKHPLIQRALAKTGEIAGSIVHRTRPIAEEIERLPLSPLSVPAKIGSFFYLPKTEEQLYGQAVSAVVVTKFIGLAPEK